MGMSRTIIIGDLSFLSIDLPKVRAEREDTVVLPWKGTDLEVKRGLFVLTPASSVHLLPIVLAFDCWELKQKL